MNFKLKKSEFDHFSDLASEWWLKNGKFKTLHDIQSIRIKYIQDVINRDKFTISQNIKKSFDPKRILNPGKMYTGI